MASLIDAYLDSRSQPQWLARIDRIAPDARPRWGALTPATLMPHLRRSIQLSLGEVRMEDKSIPVARTLLRWLSFSLPLPWPKGKIKAPPIFFPEDAGQFEEERQELHGAIGRFTAALDADPNRIEVSEIFGPLPLKVWGRIHGRHMEHHLRQFSV